MTGSSPQRKCKRRGHGRPLAVAALAVALLLSPRTGWGTVIMTSPLFEGQDLSGTGYSLAGLLKDGKTTIVYFWALRCAPCLREMAALEELYQARHHEGLEILAIEATGSSPQKIEEILGKLKDIMIVPSYPIIPDPDSTLNRKFSVQVTPRTFLVNRLGEVVYSFESFSGELKVKLDAGVEALLSGKAFNPEEPTPAPAAPAPAKVRPEQNTTAPPESPQRASSDEEFEKNRYFGDFYLHKEEDDKAIASYQKAIGIKPENIHIRLKIGEAYARKKMYVEAREAWEYILRISPGNAEADANLRRLLRGEY